jgi:hypothetical protein
MTRVIETLAIRVLQEKQIANVALSTFGATAKAYQASLLTQFQFGLFKFIGRPYNQVERESLFSQLEERVRRNKAEGKQHTVVKVVGAVVHEDVTYLTYWMDDEVLKLYCNAFNRKISYNPNEMDEPNMHIIIHHE